MIRFLAIALLLLAQGAPKQIPGPGVPVPEKDRAELEAGLKELAAETDPDVLVYHKAVDWALRHNEILNAKELPVAKAILKDGLARAQQLKEGKPAWRTATGLVVRAYVSRIDASLQPYGLVIPTTYKAGTKHRLDFWLHGRSETLTELNFISQRQKSAGEFTPSDTIVCHLYGRFCNASKFAGEIDLFEALEDIRKKYSIDEDRLVVRGFSMGGASTWHLAAHHAGLWAAAAPGAGFAETPVYAKMFNDPIKPTDYEQKLWHWYNATDYAANLSNCPVVAYSGELDPQKAAADTMAKAMKEEGLELVHVIGPKTEHKYEPEAKKEVARRVDELASKGREPNPAKIRFTTWTLRYNRMKWVTVDGLERHWERARVDAELGDQTVTVSTANVSEFTLQLPKGITRASIDRQEPAFGSLNSLTFRKLGGRWVQGDSDPNVLRKRHGLQGPIDDAFMDRFLFVTPTGKPMSEALGVWVAREQKEAVEAWRRTMRGDARIVKDSDLTDAEIAASHVVLWGDPSSNQVLARIADKLPIRWTSEGVKVGEKTHPSERHVPVMIYPNPLNPKRYVVLNSGFTWKENAALSNSRHVPILPDWAVLDITVPPTKRMSERVVQADFFGEAWELR